VKTVLRVLLLLVVAAIPSSVLAQATPSAGRPFLNPMFTDNMVLQRGQSVPVWGWTTPGASVTVSVAGKSATATAGTDGEWTAKLPPLPIGGPYTLTVSGPQTVALNNVLVGDVWVCSGQSNMEFGVGNLLNPNEEIAAADYPQIRLFKVNKPKMSDPQTAQTMLSPQATVSGTSAWEVCTPDNLRTDGDWGGFTAVGYFFGRDLYQDLHVPIGLIHTSWGGTPAQAWTSAQALQKMPDFRPRVAQMEAVREAGGPGTSESLAQRTTAWYRQNDPGSTSGLGWADPAMEDSAWKTMTLPGYFQQAGDPELAHINGVVWFRRTFDVPADAAGKDMVLHFLADDNDTTWVNGTRVGATEGANRPRAYTLAASLLKPTGNVIAIRVLDTGGNGGIYGDPASLALMVADGPTVPLAGPWRYKLGVDLAKTTPLPVQVNLDQNSPTVLYNGMVNPLIPFGIKGAIWYQGESNAGQAYQYRTLLPTMIGDWRGRWREGRFPFLIVQLAGFTDPPAQPGDDPSGWAELREAQWLTAKNTPNTGIATAIDIGDPKDIHPKNKQEVGRRLALVAWAQVYHEKVEDYGPVYRSMTVEGNAIRLRFDHTGGGLVTQGGGPPAGFAVAGSDRKWAWADARIDGDTVVVSSPQVPRPVAVRYAWAAGPLGNLAGRDGLPMFPFRTDNWPGVTVNNK